MKRSTSLVAAAACLAATVSHGAIVTDSGAYSGVASSFNTAFGGFPVSNLFDQDPLTEWAIDYTTNPQGQDQGWISVTLDQSYLIDTLRFAPRTATGTVDSINELQVWISEAVFGVDVTDAAETNAFYSANDTSAALTIGPFTNNTEQDYSLTTAVQGRYILARFLNTDDTDANRNLGGKTFLIGAAPADVPGTVPVPGTLPLIGAAALGLVGLRRRRLAHRLP